MLLHNIKQNSTDVVFCIELTNLNPILLLNGSPDGSFCLTSKKGDEEDADFDCEIKFTDPLYSIGKVWIQTR